MPEKSRADLLIALGLFVVTCLYLRIFYNYTKFNPDEGLILQGAERILNGEVLYRDFFSFYTPGSYYWTALLFKVFGNSLLVARAALVVYGGIFSVFTYLLARRVCSRWAAIFTVYLLTLTALPSAFVYLHNWDSTVWACLAVYFAVRFLETPNWRFASTMGAFSSLTCLFEQSKGGGLVLGLALGFGAILALSGNRKFKLQHIGAAGAGFALPLLLTASYFALQHSLPQMLEAWTWPLWHYSSVNKVPYGWLELTPSSLQEIHAATWPVRLGIIFILSPYILVPVLPFLALGFLGLSGYRLRRGQDNRDVARYLVLVSGALVGLFLSVLIARPDTNHILFDGPLFFLVLAWGLEDSCVRSQLWNTLRPLATLDLLLSFTALGLALLLIPLHALIQVRTRRGTLKADMADSALEELQARVQPGQKIFIYPYQPLYYFLSATFNATGYEALFPGMHTPEQFDEAFRELGSARPPVVLIQPSFPEVMAVYWQAKPSKEFSGQDPGVLYLLAHYRPCKVMMTSHSLRFVFMVRKDLSCAGPL
ncbi:MAG TPA: glycosyltransferase family 39 protein [Terriglobia bacterium]|nr:glycosyltransferase family 39 protein [Terriglobia bacterium]